MTTINLHGILGVEFGKTFFMNIARPKDALESINCNRPTFKKRIFELLEQGMHYSIIVDGDPVSSMDHMNLKKNPKVVDVVPVICGQGGTIIVGLLAQGLTAMGFTGAAGSLVTAAGGLTTLGSTLSAAINIVASVLIQSALAPKPDQQKTESTVSGAKESFMISNQGNLAEQGIPVPVGYGRLRTGSYIIQFTTKSYSQKQPSKQGLIGTKDETKVDLVLSRESPS